MDCQETAQKLSAFLDGELSQAEGVQVRKHLEACRRCAAECESLAFAWERVLELPRSEPRTDLWPRLDARLAGSTGLRLSRWLSWSPFPALATAALIVGLLLGLQVGGLVVNPGPPAAGHAAQTGPEPVDVQYFDDVFPGSLADAMLNARVDSQTSEPGRMTR
jgi:anti-sigma factor RsiW